jgi:hypothetical protein
MTRVGDTAALWVSGERWGTTPELAAAVTEEERLNFAKAILCAAVSACGAGGGLSTGELEKIHSIARQVDVPAEVVEEYLDIYDQEQALRTRRIALTFPVGLPYEVPSG